MISEIIKRLTPALTVVFIGFMLLSFTILYFPDHFKISVNPNNILIILLVPIVLAVFIAVETERAISFVVKSLAIILFMVTFSGVAVSILYSDLFLDPLKAAEATHGKEMQVFAAVSFAGMMGGIMKYLSVESVSNGKEMDLWLLVHSAITGLFVSVVIFFILRAGIINQTQIDTFNVWGVTGVAAMTGFFGDRVIQRLSGLYNEVIGKNHENES